ncbi:TetR/AcrR family transcriptional regulator [Ktedonosporobacter rubrisoli]|uniref:TetR/AcrR family transcriptional regulator n=1 Tax=Ktedonosporobacter rubrisoli TaxID=2509675 RepID=A0A4P6JV81_KTERU|nr:TetR/AcrR family transcriptional regulator [Ktedonosporobacter rubrisoli]QBD79240.1 TetR/AcrR family transcriptional regulator [Ktedonosporobacter rubrisoli]
MHKGEQTRQAILARAAQVFSLSGYAGTSMDTLTRATGLTKGGIYNHFGSKEALAVEAFDFSSNLVRARFKELLRNRQEAIERLMAVLSIFQSLLEEPLLQGGCPLLNTAIEADDTNPVLRERAQKASADWRKFITRTVQSGIERQEIKPESDAEEVASVLIATLEGAIMLSKLHADMRYMDQAIQHLTRYLHSLQLT